MNEIKPVLRRMIDNNKPYWRPATIQGAHKQLDEYEAKAKAFDSLKNKLENEVNILKGNVSGFPYVDAPIDSSISHFERILEMIKKLESGGSDAEK